MKTAKRKHIQTPLTLTAADRKRAAAVQADIDDVAGLILRKCPDLACAFIRDRLVMKGDVFGLSLTNYCGAWVPVPLLVLIDHACETLGQSRSQFLRDAVREKAEKMDRPAAGRASRRPGARGR